MFGRKAIAALVFLAATALPAIADDVPPQLIGIWKLVTNTLVEMPAASPDPIHGKMSVRELVWQKVE